MAEMEFDLIAIGGGPAGVSGALAAAAFGKKAALIEMLPVVGGSGINTGTLPSKALRESALVISGWRSRKLLGLDVSLRSEATLADFMYHEKRVIAGERAYFDSRLQARNVKVVRGTACFSDAHTIQVASDSGPLQLRGEVILIATGSSPVRSPEFPFEHPRVHDSDEILTIETLPRSLAIVGAGVIGSEYACTFAALGVEVHVIDGRDRLLSFLDEEVANILTLAMERAGVKFHWKERVTACQGSEQGEIELTLTSGTSLRVTDLLVAGGRQSNTAGLNLPAAGITPGTRGLIPVNEHYRTEVGNIYAAGDVIGAPALAATGMEQARVAVCHAFNLIKKEFSPILPIGVYTIPEASMVGETEASLQEKGISYVAGRAMYAQNPRGRLIGDESGMLKLLFRRGDMKLMGVHVIGEQATELVHIGLIALATDSDWELFNRTCFNYPTLGDLYKYAAYDALRESLAVPGQPSK